MKKRNIVFIDSSGLKLGAIMIPFVLVVAYVVGVLLPKYDVIIPIPPLAVGGGIEMTFALATAGAFDGQTDSIRIQQPKK